MLTRYNDCTAMTRLPSDFQLDVIDSNGKTSRDKLVVGPSRAPSLLISGVETVGKTKVLSKSHLIDTPRPTYLGKATHIVLYPTWNYHLSLFDLERITHLTLVGDFKGSHVLDNVTFPSLEYLVLRYTSNLKTLSKTADSSINHLEIEGVLTSGIIKSISHLLFRYVCCDRACITSRCDPSSLEKLKSVIETCCRTRDMYSLSPQATEAFYDSFTSSENRLSACRLVYRGKSLEELESLLLSVGAALERVYIPKMDSEESRQYVESKRDVEVSDKNFTYCAEYPRLVMEDKMLSVIGEMIPKEKFPSGSLLVCSIDYLQNCYELYGDVTDMAIPIRIGCEKHYALFPSSNPTARLSKDETIRLLSLHEELW